MCLMWQRIRQGVRYNPWKTTMTESKSLSLKNVKKIVFRFDPFYEQNDSIRHFMPLIMLERVRQTNPSCAVKVSVVNDRSAPCFRATLSNGVDLVCKTENLTALHLVQLFKRYIGQLDSEGDQAAITAGTGAEANHKAVATKKAKRLAK